LAPSAEPLELLYKAKAQSEMGPKMSWEENDEITTTVKSLRLAQEQAIKAGSNARAQRIIEALIGDAVLSTNLDVRVLERITKIIEETS
jgi:hypothetical protein